MTGHEAHRLAAHATMPEIAPTCEKCGATKSHFGHYKSRDGWCSRWRCDACVTRAREAATRSAAVDRKKRRYAQPDARTELPELAPFCEHGHKKTQTRSTKGLLYWVCLTCRSLHSRKTFAAQRTEDHPADGKACPKCSKPMSFLKPCLSSPYGQHRCHSCERERKREDRAIKSHEGKKRALTFTEKEVRDYRKAWANIQRMPKVEVTV